LNKYIKFILFIILYLLLALSLYKSISIIRKDTYRDKIPFVSVSKWIKNNLMSSKTTEINPKKLIFTSSWDNTPYLFYHLPEFKYLVMLDPYFMYSYSPEKYRIWEKISRGKALSPALSILKTFKTNIVLVTQKRIELIRQLSNSRYAVLVYKNDNGDRVFLLRN
ncbi:MAG TPA: hypothetical protein QF753_21770, partial [Victivallales bacterium]|nr:hypothetical protein [Victivallales bacterium]